MARSILGDIGHYLGERASRRTWALAAQDGIISTAGILLGFAGAGAGERTMAIAGTSAIVAGMLTAGGAKWSETAADREAELAAIAEERREMREERDADRAALVEYYAEKGLDSALAGEVADALMRRSPLKAALESEHGIVRLTSAAEVVLNGLGAAIAFGLGAAIPFAIAWYVPLKIEPPLIAFAVLVSLTMIAVVGARAGGMDVRRTLLRTLIVAGVTILVSYAVGDAVY
jgi:VIT1/CCC1 family predicted Fe2+/Mn2+ transporter